MNLGSILKKVGTSVIKDVVPGGGAILELVNTFLPEDQKLPSDATGDQAKNAIQTLSSDQQAMLMAKELDVEIEDIRSWTTIQEALAKADEAGSSTRPWIAKALAIDLIITNKIFMLIYGIALFKSSEPLKVVAENWEILAVLTSLHVMLLKAYFGMRTDEKKARYGAAIGAPPTQSIGILGSIFNRK